MVLTRQDSRLARNETRGGNLLLSGTVGPQWVCVCSAFSANRMETVKGKFQPLHFYKNCLEFKAIPQSVQG